LIHDYIKGALFFAQRQELIEEFKQEIIETEGISIEEKVKKFQELKTSIYSQDELKALRHHYKRAYLYQALAPNPPKPGFLRRIMNFFVAMIWRKDTLNKAEKLKASRTINQFFIELRSRPDRVALLQGILDACNDWRVAAHRTMFQFKYEPFLREDEPALYKNEPSITEEESSVTETEPELNEDEPSLDEDESSEHEDGPPLNEDEPTSDEAEPELTEDEPWLTETESSEKEDEPWLDEDDELFQNEETESDPVAEFKLEV
jgi:hypothetical protein